MKNGIIYKSKSPSNKFYIGKTIKNLEKRKREHYYAFCDLNHKTKFHCALRKYGFENFEWEIIEEIDVSLLDDREKYYISLYDSFNNGYNMTLGGDGIIYPKFGKENPFYGKQHSIETKDKISRKKKGINRSIESCVKQSNTIKGFGNHMFGKNHTIESKYKMSKNKTKIYILTFPNGEKIELFGLKKLIEYCKENLSFSGKHLYNVKKCQGFELCLK